MQDGRLPTTLPAWLLQSTALVHELEISHALPIHSAAQLHIQAGRLPLMDNELLLQSALVHMLETVHVEPVHSGWHVQFGASEFPVQLIALLPQSVVRLQGPHGRTCWLLSLVAFVGFRSSTTTFRRMSVLLMLELRFLRANSPGPAW